jgi:quinol monooxygenase YgiN
MIVISGVLEIGRQDVPEFVRLSRELLGPTRAEPGCVAYTFAASIDDPDRFEIFEEWTDQEALDAHARTGHYRSWGRALRGLEVKRMAIARYEASDRTVLV